MKILTAWLRHYLPTLSVTDRQLADDLTLRGIAVEGVHDLTPESERRPSYASGELKRLQEKYGSLFEMDITTNRVDAMNHYGIAREAATIYNLPLEHLNTKLPVGTLVDGPFPIRIAPDAKGLCGRFTAQVLRNVTIAPSTGKISEYFNLLGQKQISNAVDASNYVLLGMGHPTHAFDLDKIEGGIVVRLAHKGEKLKLLDGTERTLEADDLVVADEKKALALAGVMGGWDSMITPETKNILIEAAWFDPATVRRSSRRHLLHTDASHRFERGADFNAAPVANALVAQRILQAGGKIEGELIDVIDPDVAARTANRPTIELSVKQVQRHLGKTIDPEGITGEIVARYLSSLGCELILHGLDIYRTKLPSWRLDLEREIDLIEEVARVYGYNRFANTLPTALPVIAHPTAAKEAAVRTRLLALGFSESISSSFASQQDSDLFYTTKQTGQQPVPMENPLSEEASLLRPSLIPGMATMLAHNLNRDVREVRLFEQGQIFTGTIPADASHIADVHESPQLTLGLTTANPQTIAPHMAQDVPFFELKGAIESLLSLFTLPGGAEAVTFTPESPAWLQPGRSATALLNNQPIAHFGELAQTQAQHRKLRQPVYLAQVDLATLYDLSLRKITAHDLSRYQAVERDFSFVFPDAVQWHTIACAIQALAIPELQSRKPIEVWRNEKKYPGVYSLLVRTIFQSLDRTLRDEELATWSTQIIETLTKLGGTLRA
ncbi:phenylalanyl-tRNA synthetase beta subunit [Edaphobacter aggregans]|uniref:Phenylalanine--tRNA ligase beta subunit n=1 Tax=Edaphobacter aggregans TaxID=570835 RepID=A0A3R9QAY9_9BACT|nr:phenylalanine--tRNA ligase subunit beta [Edaphobacter aggregans]RSL17443.1 phenylalanyl-tRNA synthetase beta subunit [Edaphobacter aggregans]